MRGVVAAWLERIYLAPGAKPRAEDVRKIDELTALLPELRAALHKHPRQLTIVDAASGLSYAALAAAELVLAPAQRTAHVILIERDPRLAARARQAASQVVAPGCTIEVRNGDVADAALWPAAPDLVIALHACGAASDRVLDAALAASARRLLLVPCCTGVGVDAEPGARGAAGALGIPRHAAVRRGFIEAWVAAERTLRLEAGGMQTEVVEFCPKAVTPYNLLWRARRVREPGRMAAARAELARLQQPREEPR